MATISGKIRLCLLVICLSLFCTMLGQGNRKIDSLEALLKVNKIDTIRIRALNNLSHEKLIIGEYAIARKYAEQALVMAENLNYQAGIYWANTRLGNIDFYEGNEDQVLKRFTAAANAAQEAGVDRFIAGSKQNLGNLYYTTEKYVQALEMHFAALSIYKKLDLKTEIAGSIANIALIYDELGNNHKALEYYLKALKIYDSLLDKRGQSTCYLNIGNLYKGQKKSIDYFLKALQIDEELGDKSGMATDYMNIGGYYKDSGEFEKALDYLFRATKIRIELGEDLGVANCKYNTAIIFSQLKNYEKAERILEEVKVVGLKYGEPMALGFAYSALANVYLYTRRFEKARIAANNALMFAEKTGNFQIQKQNYQTLAQIDSAEGNFSAALANFKKHAFLADSIENLNDEEKFAQLEMSYEFSKKEDSLNYVQQVTSAKLKQQQAISAKQKAANNYLVIGLLLSVLLSFFIYRTYQTKQQLKFQQLRNKIASDLHDDVGSTLSSISMFSQIAREQSKDAAPMVEKIGEYSRGMLDAMADIVWTINPENDQFEKIIMRMRNFAYELLGAKQIDFDFRADNVSDLKLSMEARKNLYLIFKEATNNLAKYADAKVARFEIQKEKDKLTLLIRDNGKGFIADEETEGNGLKNMKKESSRNWCSVLD